MLSGNILIGKPRTYPEKLEKDLASFFSKIADIKTAYIAQIFNINSGEPPHLLVAIDIAGNLDSISDDLSLIIKKNVPIDEYVDIVALSSKELTKHFSKLTPFYHSK